MAHYYSPPAFDDQGRRLTPSERFARPNGSPFLSETHTRKSVLATSPHDNAVPLSPPGTVTPAAYSPATSSPRNGFSSDGSSGVSPCTPTTSAATSPIAQKGYNTYDAPHRPVFAQLQPPFGYAPLNADQGMASPRQSEDKRVKLPSDDERNAQLKDARHTTSKARAKGSDSSDLKSPKKKSFFSFSRRGSTAPTGADERDTPQTSSGRRKSVDERQARGSAVSETEQTDVDDPSTSRRARPKSRSFASAIARRSKSLGRSSEPVQSESVADGRRVHQSAIRIKASSSSSSSLVRRSSSSSLGSEWILLTQQQQQQNENKANGPFGPGSRSASSLNSSESFAIVQNPGLPPVSLPPTPGKEGQHRSMPPPQTPVRSKHHRMQSPAMSPTPAAPFTPERNVAQSPPFYLRNGDSPIQRGSLPPQPGGSSRTSAGHPGMASPSPSPLSPRGRPLPTPPSKISPTAAMTSYRNGAAQLQHVQPHHSSMPPRPGLNRSSQPPWSAEAHVFGKAGQAVQIPPPPGAAGPRATLSHIRPSLERQYGPSSPQDILPPSPAFSKPHSPLGRSSPSSEGGRGTRVHSPLQPSPSRSRTRSNNSKRGDVVRAGSAQSSRQRVSDLLEAHRIRKNSLRSSSPSASPAASAYEVKPCSGKPRIEEALLKYPATILASILDHLSYQACRALLQASSSLWNAAQADQGEFAEVVLQRYLGSYGYLPAVPQGQLAEAVRFTTSDLHSFLAGMDMSVSEYAIFANEHRTGAVPKGTIRILRTSTRAYSKLVCRFRLQNAKPQLFLPILKSHWARPTSRYPISLYKPGRCAIFRVWVPCASQWMTDVELVECEREVYRSGVWNLLRKGDLVRNVALSDIANEGITIFDGKYLRDLSHVHDTIGHLPSWVNGLAFPPSHYHNQIASSTSMPVIFLDLSPFQIQMQRNLKLCKENVDMSSPSGETYKVTRYVYRTVVDLVAGTVLDTAAHSGSSTNNDTDVPHNDWIGQIVVETEGTSEAANALIQRLTPVSRKVAPNQPRPPASVNNRPYRVARHQSRPGLIFVRPVDEKPHQLLQRA